MGIRLSCVFLLLGFSQVLSAQSDEVRRKQRAIFVYKITQQVGWANTEYFSEFTIAVLGEDPIVEDLREIEKEGKLVWGKSLKIEQIESIEEATSAQLVYVHNRHGFDIRQLLQKVRGKNVLIVSEDYGYNESMINMIEIGDLFQFEINRARLELENFRISNSLSELAVSSAEKWQELYLESTESLERAREKVAEQSAMLASRKKDLDDQKAQIEKQTKQIAQRNAEVERLRLQYQELSKRNKEQQLLFEEKEQALNEVADQLSEQQKIVMQRKDEIDRLDRILKAQVDQITGQEDEIDEQNEVLDIQRDKLDYQRNFTILFIVLTISTAMAGFFIWRNYRLRKRAHLELEKKNAAIETQSRELAAQNEEMEQFAYVASHDLQEPLNTITSLVTLINTEELDARGQKSVKFISESTNRMKGLIKGLLEYSRLGRDVTFSKVDCNQIISDVQANLAKVLEDTKTILHVGQLPVVTGHEVKLTLLFQNLISNAIKFSGKETIPEVTINVRKRRNESKKYYWEFSVADNGIGIQEKFLETVFVIFKRLHAKTEYQGTGIGLAHCKKIVDLHGGKIWVESKVGEGSTFLFSIPVRANRD